MAQEIDRQAFRLTLSRLVQLFLGSGIRGTIIGGLAVSVWSRERFTRDIDAVTTAANEDLDRLLSVAVELGLAARLDEPAAFARQSRMILLRDTETGLDVDIAMAGFPFEFDAIDRAATVNLAGVAIPVAQADDIIIMKAVAGRRIDFADIVEILKSNPPLDLTRVRRYLDQFGEAVDDPGLTGRFEELVREAEGPPA